MGIKIKNRNNDKYKVKFNVYCFFFNFVLNYYNLFLCVFLRKFRNK